jgi:hypothetical protein
MNARSVPSNLASGGVNRDTQEIQPLMSRRDNRVDRVMDDQYPQ